MAESIQEKDITQIDIGEINSWEVIGRGSYGVVYKARWKSNFFAVKEFDSKMSSEEVNKEVSQLWKIRTHPNIIQVYGVSTKESQVFLVMEYADGGSLQKFLHSEPKCSYTKEEALEWAYQCAEGVAYLHAMKPKPILHRDLKPANLLLTNKHKILKICDFGTAVDLKTLMTNNKGSAAWMAPEVFTGTVYTEKCDVFSWGIILWEMFAREVPYKEIPLPCAILYQVSMLNKRPELKKDWPEEIKNLMISCWHSNPSMRPSMKDILVQVKNICEFDFNQLNGVIGATRNLDITTKYNNQRDNLEFLKSLESAIDFPNTCGSLKGISEEDIKILATRSEANKIASGSFANIYKVEWRNQLKAVKVYHSYIDGAAVRKEVNNLLLLNGHPNIITFFGRFMHQSKIFTLMEYADSGTLHDFLHGEPRRHITENHLMNLILQFAEAVAYLHGQKPKSIIHRALKPSHLLLLDNYNTLKICDFFFSAGIQIMMTNFEGTAAYMAPEISSHGTFTEKCDVYSWGIILWEATSRQIPFQDKTRFQILWSAHKGLRPLLQPNQKGILKHLITSCWDAEPKNRPSMEEVVKIMKDLPDCKDRNALR